MRFDVVTLFPEVFEPYLSASILGKAKENGLIEAELWQLRDFATDKHKTVDDTPYGGGPGMVMKVGPIDRALQARDDQAPGLKDQQRKTVLLAARGKQFTQRQAEEYAKLDGLTLICGRYEGVDQRVADHLADEEVSIGPYVLAGGELAALVVIEAVARLIPGVLGNPESLTEESFASMGPTSYKLKAKSSTEYPQYTKPEDYNGWKVPEVLLSGNHGAIREWRARQRGE